MSGEEKNEAGASSIIPLVEWMIRSLHLSEKINIHQGRASVGFAIYLMCFFYPYNFCTEVQGDERMGH